MYTCISIVRLAPALVFDDGSLVTSGAHMVNVVIGINFYQAARLESQLFN